MVRPPAHCGPGCHLLAGLTGSGGFESWPILRAVDARPGSRADSGSRCVALELRFDHPRVWSYAEPALVAVCGADANLEFQLLTSRLQQHA
eukprot:3711840-Lingulodinium_polyedra.AAC.1